MKLIYKDDKCVLIKFDEKAEALRQQGWLGDEAEARIFYPEHGTREVRIFKDNGESYVLKEDSNDPMIRMKISKLLKFANDN